MKSHPRPDHQEQKTYSTATMIAAGTAQLLIRSAALRRAEQNRARARPGRRQLLALELAGAAAELDRQRVHRPAVLRHLEMEVRAGRQAGRADIADHLRRGAPSRRDKRRCGSCGRSASRCRRHGRSRPRGRSRRASRRATTRPSAAATIGVPAAAARSTPGVEALVAEDRVEALAEARGHPAVDRHAHRLRCPRRRRRRH